MFQSRQGASISLFTTCGESQGQEGAAVLVVAEGHQEAPLLHQTQYVGHGNEQYSSCWIYGERLLCLACLEERESVDKSTLPGLSSLSLSSRQLRKSSRCPYAH